MRKERKIVLISALAVLALLALISSVLPVMNSGFHAGGIFNNFWLMISDSGTKWGTIILVVLISLLALGHYRKNPKVWPRIIVFCLGFLLSLKGFAELNEHYLKPYLAEPRPSFVQLDSRGVIDVDVFYVDYPTKEKRRAYLYNRLKKEEVQTVLADIDPDILAHWVYETGFSMPSGHTQNAFILAVVLSYVLLRLKNSKLKVLAYGLMTWGLLMALSRTALGVHTSPDVLFGAASGALFGMILILTGLVDVLIPDRQKVDQAEPDYVKA